MLTDECSEQGPAPTKDASGSRQQLSSGSKAAAREHTCSADAGQLPSGVTSTAPVYAWPATLAAPASAQPPPFRRALCSVPCWCTLPAHRTECSLAYSAAALNLVRLKCLSCSIAAQTAASTQMMLSRGAQKKSPQLRLSLQSTMVQFSLLMTPLSSTEKWKVPAQTLRSTQQQA